MKICHTEGQFTNAVSAAIYSEVEDTRIAQQPIQTKSAFDTCPTEIFHGCTLMKLCTFDSLISGGKKRRAQNDLAEHPITSDRLERKANKQCNASVRVSDKEGEGL